MRLGTSHDESVAVATESRAGWAMAALSATVVGFWVVFGGLADIDRYGVAAFVENAYASLVFALAFPAVGAVILSRLPGHRLGWLYCLSGFAASVTLASYSYAQHGLVDRPGSLPGAVAAGWVSSWIWICGFAPLMTFGVLWFPDGRLLSRRWWPVEASAGLFIGLGAVSVALRPGPLENHPIRDNPLGLPLPRAWFDAVGTGGLQPLFAFALIGSLASLAMRYLRGTSDDRRQLRWFLVAAGLVALSGVFSRMHSVAALGTVLAVVAFPLLPLSVGLAVLRHRLFGIDLAVRRSLVFGWLIAAVLAVYAGVVLVLDLLLGGRAQPAVTLMAAGVVAVVVEPMRRRLQKSVDRMLYGDSGDPYAVLARLGRRLESAGTAEDTMSETVETIARTLRLPYVAVELAEDKPGLPIASFGASPKAPALIIALTHGGQSVGTLRLGHRQDSPDFSDGENGLFQDLARQVALAAHSVSLQRALQRSSERLIATREEERQRLRRDLHDGLGPALAGVALGVDAARNMMGTDQRGADALLEDLKQEVRGCVLEVRRIVDGLCPAVLDELGLVVALNRFAERMSARDDDVRVQVQAPETLPQLPAAVELAAYRIAVEAITNVARHAHAHSCLVRLSVDDELAVEIRDDGVGFPVGQLTGVGIGSMTDRAAELGGRCLISQLDSGGTHVLAHLPLSPRHSNRA